MTYPYEKIRHLRLRGLTYNEINSKLNLNIPKSTLAYICKGLELPDYYSEKIRNLSINNLELARLASAESAKSRFNKQEDLAREEAYKLASKLTPQSLLSALAMLYLGEGSKRSGFRGLSLGSSDPLIINLYILLLDMVYGIPVKRLKARITYRADQNLTLLTEYWSNITGINKKDFYKTKPDPRTLGKPTKNTSYRGVCTIYCSGTDKQLALQMYAEVLFEKLRGCSSADRAPQWH